MTVIPVKFQYDIESEVRRVKETLDNTEWLIKNNYKFLLPSGIKDFKNTTTETIRELIKNEYDQKTYQVAEQAILKSWGGNNELIRKINQKMVGAYALGDITVILTRYGTQGSYITPDSMIINISEVPPEFLIKTVIHESLHLMIENLVKKYSVAHWVKERIVDLVINVEFKSRFKMQSVPEWALAADAIFKGHYPNLALLVEKAAEISPDK